MALPFSIRFVTFTPFPASFLTRSSTCPVADLPTRDWAQTFLCHSCCQVHSPWTSHHLASNIVGHRSIKLCFERSMIIHGLSAHSFPGTSLRSTSTWKSILGVCISHHPFSFTFAGPYRMDQFLHTCEVDAEPLHRYRRGGYHPIRLGDLLKNGRYRLGWLLDSLGCKRS